MGTERGCGLLSLIWRRGCPTPPPKPSPSSSNAGRSPADRRWRITSSSSQSFATRSFSFPTPNPPSPCEGVQGLPTGAPPHAAEVIAILLASGAGCAIRVLTVPGQGPKDSRFRNWSTESRIVPTISPRWEARSPHLGSRVDTRRRSLTFRPSMVNVPWVKAFLCEIAFLRRRSSRDCFGVSNIFRSLTIFSVRVRLLAKEHQLV